LNHSWSLSKSRCTFYNKKENENEDDFIYCKRNRFVLLELELRHWIYPARDTLKIKILNFSLVSLYIFKKKGEKSFQFKDENSFLVFLFLAALKSCAFSMLKTGIIQENDDYTKLNFGKKISSNFCVFSLFFLFIIKSQKMNSNYKLK
jgi:hypothetical protein